MALTDIVINLSFISILVQSEIDEDFSTNNRSVLPRADCCMAVGYYNGVISLLGGLKNTPATAVIEYDIDAGTFTQSPDALSAAVGTVESGNFWVQNNANVYIINPTGTALQVYDLSTKTLTTWQNAAIPTIVKTTACIAYAPNVLFIMGGGDRSSNAGLNTVQRYDISASQWLSPKFMLEKRRQLSCVYSPSNDALYAIGGWDENNVDGYYESDSVEYVTVSDMETSTSTFQIAEDKLRLGLTDACAVVYVADVYILGGSSSWSATEGSDNRVYVYHNSIQILDTATNTITVSPHKLAYHVAYAAGIVAENVVYLFGGAGGDRVVTNKWQFYVFGVPAPTTTTTLAMMSTKPMNSATNEPSQKSNEADSIWMPVFIFSATALVVVCMCLLYCLYHRHDIKKKKNDAQLRMQACQASQNRSNNNIVPPPQNPINIVPDHSSMMQMAGQRGPHHRYLQPVHVVPVPGNHHMQPMAMHDRHYLQWTGEEFLQWIMRLSGGRYMCYVQIMQVTFVAHGIRGAMIPYLNEEWWLKLGVGRQMDRLELMNAVQNLVGRGEEEKKDDDVLDYEVEGNDNDFVATIMNRRLHANDDDDKEDGVDMNDVYLDRMELTQRTNTTATKATPASSNDEIIRTAGTTTGATAGINPNLGVYEMDKMVDL